MVVLYEGLLYLVFLAGLPFFIILGLVRGKYISNLPARLGFYRGPAGAHDLWIHAVSVGETIAAKPVIDAIVRRRPETTFVITTTTITGQAQAKRLYPNADVTYFPLDFSFSVRRFLRHHQPRTLATMETEIWPNVTRLARASGVQLVLANARVSDRSFPRYRLFRPVTAAILRRYSRILAREDVDRIRLMEIGALPETVETAGNVKFDYVPDETPLPFRGALTAMADGRAVVVLGSTVAGEDEMLLPVVTALVATRRVLLVVAPRKPERFPEVYRLFTNAGIRTARRSEIDGRSASADVLLLDTIGELARVYALAAAAFIGGSLVGQGGHNPIEPAAVGVPVCFGPSMTNFREIAEVLIRSGGASVVASPEELQTFIERMLSDDDLRHRAGENGQQAVVRNQGASERTAARIIETLG